MFIFKQDPAPADFQALANFLEAAPATEMHQGLWQNRVKMVARLRDVATRGTVETSDRSIYHALNLVIY